MPSSIDGPSRARPGGWSTGRPCGPTSDLTTRPEASTGQTRMMKIRNPPVEPACSTGDENDAISRTEGLLALAKHKGVAVQSPDGTAHFQCVWLLTTIATIAEHLRRLPGRHVRRRRKQGIALDPAEPGAAHSEPGVRDGWSTHPRARPRCCQTVAAGSSVSGSGRAPRRARWKGRSCRGTHSSSRFGADRKHDDNRHQIAAGGRVVPAAVRAAGSRCGDPDCARRAARDLRPLYQLTGDPMAADNAPRIPGEPAKRQASVVWITNGPPTITTAGEPKALTATAAAWPRWRQMGAR